MSADRRYGAVREIHLPVSQKLVVFEFRGSSLTMRPDGMAYVYRLQGYDADSRVAYEGRVEYQDLPLGNYTFQVQAVDRDLNYSEPVEVQLSVVPDPLRQALAEALSAGVGGEEFVGQSPALRRVQEQLRQVAPAELTVLILGETGTGKGLAARTLHQLSPHRAASFIQVTCGALPEPLIESELFGHEKGAFTGAASRRLGKVELASGGTLFLDEIGDMPLSAQVKLLRLLEEGTFERVGGERVLEAEVRIVAATNRDLRQQVQAGTFREDLYFRLQGFEVHLPPLRDRLEDLPLLALYFLGPKAAHLNKEVTALSPAAEAALMAHAWPGNVRELQHAIERAVVVCKGPVIQVGDLGLANASGHSPHALEPVTLEEFERRYILQILEQKAWRISGPQGAAAVLGLHEATLRSRLKRLGISRNS